jgi:hypothetical protein
VAETFGTSTAPTHLAALRSSKFRASYSDEVILRNIVQLGDLNRGDRFIREDGRALLKLVLSVQEGVNRHRLFQDKANGRLLYSQQ